MALHSFNRGYKYIKARILNKKIKHVLKDEEYNGEKLDLGEKKIGSRGWGVKILSRKLRVVIVKVTFEQINEKVR